MNIFLYAVTAILSVLGILELVRFLSLKLLNPKKARPKIIIYPVEGNAEDLELMIRAIHQKAKWDCDTDGSIYLLDMGLDEEGRQIAHLLAEDLDGVILCGEQNLLEKLKENLICKPQ